MGILQGLWDIARGVYTVVKGFVTAASSILLWAAAHPITAIIVGITFLAASYWLKAQPWAGAGVLSQVVGLTGEVLIGVGIGAWIGRQIWFKLKVAAKRVLVYLTPYVEKYTFLTRVWAALMPSPVGAAFM